MNSILVTEAIFTLCTLCCLAHGFTITSRSQARESASFAVYVTKLTSELGKEIELAVQCHRRIYKVNNVMDFSCNSLLLNIPEKLEKGYPLLTIVFEQLGKLRSVLSVVNSYENNVCQLQKVIENTGQLINFLVEHYHLEVNQFVPQSSYLFSKGTGLNLLANCTTKIPIASEHAQTTFRTLASMSSFKLNYELFHKIWYYIKASNGLTKALVSYENRVVSNRI
ncbi:hypothetical protein TrispH2_011535 [Trichoplax sp. H2]|nr:hypothetical protein TrispH2_011535 [Trichoplax sp. H2]|eukprot:RDD36742.1 hypothetical protein TrispH2_011535 [Trichoplax sp. H2]